MNRTLSITIGRWMVAALVPTLIAFGSEEARSQQLTVGGVAGHTGYEDLERPLGLAGRIGLPWLGLEVAASRARDESNRRGVPCAGLIPPGSTECVEQEMDITGTMATASLGRPITVLRNDDRRLAAVPTLGVAGLEAERTGAESGRTIWSDRRVVRLGLAAEYGGGLAVAGALEYSVRVYGGSLITGGPTRCADCFQAFRENAGEIRLSAGITYRW